MRPRRRPSSPRRAGAHRSSRWRYDARLATTRALRPESLALLLLAACSSGGGGAGAAPPGDPGLDLSLPLPAGVARAGVITRPEELVGGPAATGRLGDVKLYNSRVAFVVQAAGASSGMVGLYGGNVVDADVARPAAEGRDVFREQSPVVGYQGTDARTVEVLADGSAGGEAVVRATALLARFPYLPDIGLSITPEQAAGLEVIHEYRLAPDSQALRMITRVRNAGTESLRPLDAGDAWIFGGRLAPFVPGSGFADASGGPIFAARGDGVAYAVGTATGEDFPLVLTISGIAAAIAFSEELGPGEEVRFERLFAVGTGGVSDPLAAVLEAQGVALGGIEGRVLDSAGAAVPFARVQAANEAGKLVGELEADGEGRFAGRLPLGSGQLLLGATAEGRSAVSPTVQVALTTGATASAEVVVGAAGRVRYSITDSEGQPIPARITLRTAGGVYRVPTLPGGGEFSVEPGTYDAVVSRGFEYDIATLSLEVAPGSLTEIEASLARVVDTTGFVAGDFHLHSENSPDSQLRLADRVAACAGEGLEWVVATDHDHVTDYAPHVEELGLSPFLVTTVGEEISTISLGHFNGWPLVPRPGLGGAGAVAWAGLTPAELAGAARELGATVTQINHPRHSQGLFNAIDFDPATGRAAADPISLGFREGTDLDDFPYDAIEVFNGKRLDQLFGDGAGQKGSFLDWAALVDRGHRFTFTGNSDSHHLGQEAGYPRTYVAAASDDPTGNDQAALDAALKRGEAVVSAGPFVRFSLQTPTGVVALGGTGGPGTLRLEVQAPPWMEVTSVELLERGAIPVATYTLAAGELAGPEVVVRLSREVPVSPPADSWYMVIVRGETALWPVYDERPLAFTNPIFVDVGGDGWTPPLR